MAGQLTSKERLLAAIRWQEIDRIPVFAGGGGYLVEGKNPRKEGEALAQAALSAWKEFQGDIIQVTGGAHNSFIPEAFGARLKRPENDAPWFDKPLVATHEDADGLKAPDPYKDKYLLAILHALKIVKKKADNQVVVASTIGGIFNLAVYIFGAEELMKYIVKDIELVHKVCRKINRAQIAYGKALIEGGAELIQVANASCSPFCISREIYEKVALPYLAKQIRSYQKEGAYTSIGNSGYAHLDIVGQTGSNILSFNNYHDEADALSVAQKVFAHRFCVAGGVDNDGVLFVSSAQELEKRVKEVVMRLPYRTGAILNIGAPGPNYPHAKIKAMIKAARKYGDYSKNRG